MISRMLLFVSVVFFMLSCNQQDKEKPVDAGIVNNPATANTETPQTSERLAAIEFEKEVHDFGKVIEGERVSYTFTFKNTGNHDLVIVNAAAGCGCTVPVWSKEPIRPGGTGRIDVEYNSQGRPGIIDRQVTVTANTNPNVHYLYIKGEVVNN